MKWEWGDPFPMYISLSWSTDTICACLYSHCLFARHSQKNSAKCAKILSGLTFTKWNLFLSVFASRLFFACLPSIHLFMSVGVYLSVFAFIFSSTKLPKSLNYIHIVFIIAKHEAGFENTTKHTAHRKERRKIERKKTTIERGTAWHRKPKTMSTTIYSILSNNTFYWRFNGAVHLICNRRCLCCICHHSEGFQQIVSTNWQLIKSNEILWHCKWAKDFNEYYIVPR